MELKPQELLVLYKVALHGKQSWTYASLGVALFMSPAEVHASVKRAMAAGLAASRKPRKWHVVRPALIEFSVHGVRYAFPPELGPVKRGVPTSFGTAPLLSLIESQPGEAPVWAHPAGNKRGPSISPIYRTAPEAAIADPMLHKALALLDALRMGRSRERSLATKLLSEMLGRNDDAS